MSTGTKVLVMVLITLMMGVSGVMGYLVGNDAGDKEVTNRVGGLLTEYKATLRASYEAKIANLDSCLVMCHEQGMYTYNKWRECEEILDWTLAESTPTRWSPPGYDSTVLIDGIIYERALGSRTASNNGVLKDENHK